MFVIKALAEGGSGTKNATVVGKTGQSVNTRGNASSPTNRTIITRSTGLNRGTPSGLAN